MSGPVLYMSMLFLPSDVNLFDDLVLIFLVKDFFFYPLHSCVALGVVKGQLSNDMMFIYLYSTISCPLYVFITGRK